MCWPTDKPFFCCSSAEYGIVLFDNLWASEGHAASAALLAGYNRLMAGLPIIEAVFVTSNPSAPDECLHRAVQTATECWGERPRRCTELSFTRSGLEVLDTHVTSWESDPYAYGAYSYFTLGTHCSDPSTLAEPSGQSLLWAGEATDEEYQGSVHAAVLSGRRAAIEVVSRLNH